VRKRVGDAGTPGFNAGVLVIDLDVLRARGDEYNKTVASVAVAYGNDDQAGGGGIAQSTQLDVDSNVDVDVDAVDIDVPRAMSVHPEGMR